jgi:hypothetical protein
MRHIGTALLAVGLGLAALAAGFVVFMVAAISLGALIPRDALAEGSIVALIPDAIAYIAWAVTAAAVFGYGWRRMRDTDAG